MADLSYTIEVKGVQDIDRLEATIDKLQATLNAGKGAGKSLEEVRKIIFGFKGSEGIFKSLDKNIQDLATTSRSTENAVKQSIGNLASVLKSEMLVLRQTLATAGYSAGKAASDGITQAFDASDREITKRVRGTAAKARAILTAEYSKLVGDDGLKPLTMDESAMVAMLKHQGATISTYHSRMVSNYENALAAQRKADDIFQAAQLKNLNEELATRKIMQAERLALDTSAAEKAVLVEQQAQKEKIAALNSEIAFRKQTIQQRVKEAAEAEAAEKKNQAERIAGLNSLIALRKKAHAERMAQEAAEQAAAKSTFESSVRRAVMTATNAPSGTYQTYNPASGLAGAVKTIKDTDDEAKKLTRTFGELAVSGNDVHSMARGLASGFNLLWLTWGNLAPLFVGAAISNGFMQTAKTGMEVAHTFAIIENIGENTKEQVTALSAELIRLGHSGPVGPTAIAEAMKTLSLAGLKANEILAVTQDTLNFSIAGTTSIQTAADTLVSVSTAFGMGSQGFARVGDVISKAAAESKTSVESFANAMKTASVVGEQYGVSLEDTATAIATMSQLGIEGTAAGTALRNMYADLSGRSIQVAKVLRAQGIEMRTATGEFRPMLEVVAELSDKLSQLDGISQKNLMQALLSERGAKGLVEMLRLINTEATNASGGVTNALANIRTAIEDSYGFTAINAAKMAQTTKSLFEQVGATLQTTMYEAYQNIEPTLALIAKDLKETFGSEDFKNSLTTMVRGIAEFGRSLIEVGAFLTDNIGTVALVAVGYKALTIAATRAAASQTAATIATEANTAANVANAASQASVLTGIGAIARFLPGVGTAIAVAAGAWALYDSYQRDATQSSLDYARSYTSDVAKTLSDQTSKLEAINELRRQGLTLTEAQARLEGVQSREKFVSPFSEAVNKAIKEEMEGRKKLADLEESYSKYAANDTKNKIKAQKDRVDALAARTRQAKQEELEADQKITAEVERAQRARKEAARLDQIDFDERKKRTQKFGTGAYELGQDRAGRAPYERAKIQNDNELKALQAYYDSRVSVQTDSYNRSKKILDAQRAGELVSEADFIRASNELALNYEREQIQTIEKGSEEYLKAYAARYEELARLRDAAKSDTTKEAYSTAMERLQNDAVAQMSKNAASIEKITNESNERVLLSYIKLEAEVGKLQKADKEFWIGRGLEEKKKKDAYDLQKAYNNINTSLFSTESALYASKKAEQEVIAQVDVHIEKLKQQLAIQEAILQSYRSSIDDASNNPAVTAEDLDKLSYAAKRTEAAIKAIKGTIENATKNGLAEGARAGMLAFDQERDQQKIKLRDEFSSAVYDGLTGKGKEAGQRLRDLLEQELLRKPFEVAIRAVIGEILGVGSGRGTSIAGGGTSLGDIFDLGKLGGNLSEWLSDKSFKLVSNGFDTAGGAMLSLSRTVGSVDKFLKDIPGFSGGLGSAAGYLGSIVSLVQGKPGSAIGSALGTWALPGVGTVIGSVLGGLLDSFDDSGTPHLGAAARYVKGKTEEYRQGMPADAWLDTTYKTLNPLVTALGGALDKTATAFGKKAGYEIITAFSDDSSKDGAFGALHIVGPDGKKIVDWSSYDPKWGGRWFADGEEGFKQYLNAMATDVKNVFKAMDIGEWANSILDAANDLDSLNAALIQISTIKLLFDSLGESMDAFAGISAKVQTELLNVSGGLENLAANTKSFYENFYSERERMDRLNAQVAKELSQLGYEINPYSSDAKEAFRKLVEEALTSGQGELAAKLLAMSQNFATAADYGKKAAEEFEKAAKDAADAAAKAAKDAAWANFEAAVSREKEYWSNIEKASQDAVNALTRTLDYLRSTANDLYGTVQSTQEMLAAEATTYITKALAAARSGTSVSSFDKLEQAVSSARGGVDAKEYTSQFERDRAALILAGQLQDLADISDVELTTQDKILKNAQEQLDRLDKTLAYWKQQLDGTNLLIDTTLSVEEAIKALHALLPQAKPETKPTTPSNGGAVWGPNSSSSNDLFAGAKTDYEKGTITYADGSVHYMTPDELYVAKLQRDGWSGLPSFDVGTNVVPRDMVANIHKNEAILPAEFNPWAGGVLPGLNSGIDPVLMGEILNALYAIQGKLAEMADSSASYYDQQDDVSEGGNAIRVDMMNVAQLAEAIKEAMTT